MRNVKLFIIFAMLKTSMKTATVKLIEQSEQVGLYSNYETKNQH